jgi:hypothetical protein
MTPEEEPTPHQMYHGGDITERLLALRVFCQRNKILVQASAIETLKLAIDKLSDLNRQKEIQERQFKAIERYALNKIAEHQGIKSISDHWEIYSMRNIPFYACSENSFCALATVGQKGRRND